MTIKRNFLIIVIAALLICFAVIFFNYKQHEGKIHLVSVPMKTSYGWGYKIMADDRIYIQQDYIPAISGKKGFRTEVEAEKVGNLVVQRIATNQQPIITLADLNELQISYK